MFMNPVYPHAHPKGNEVVPRACEALQAAGLEMADDTQLVYGAVHTPDSGQSTRNRNLTTTSMAKDCNTTIYYIQRKFCQFVNFTEEEAAKQLLTASHIIRWLR
jgi:hypothetical protein